MIMHLPFSPARLHPSPRVVPALEWNIDAI
jgi:hypothetical protein